MAATPPPYPGFDPRQQARIARDQARMARQQYKAQARAAVLAAKAQRDLYRLQSRAFRRSSILTPCIILAIGVVLLLVHLGTIPRGSFWIWYGHWWPLLLVFAGIVLVAEWAFDQSQANSTGPDGAPPYVRTRFTGGSGFLLAVLVFVGIMAHVFANHRDLLGHNIAFDPDHFFEFFGTKHESTQDLTQDLPPGTGVLITNPHGDVTIVGKSGDNQIHIIVNKQVYSSSDSDADSKAQRLTPEIHAGPSADALLATNVLNISVPSLEGGNADLDITVPDSAETTVTANHGDVSISALHAPVTVTANHGDIELNSITGAVFGHVNHSGNTFTAHNVTGNVSVQGRAGDITVTDVSGQTSLDGEFQGELHLEHLHGPFSFHSSRTQFTLQALNGELDISPDSGFSGSDIVGPTTLRTRSRNITLERVTGDLSVTDSDGRVDVTSAAPLGNISVDNKNGEVNVTLPARASFTVDADTRGGSIDTDFNLKSSSQHDESTLQGAVGSGGGPRIYIRTTHLDVGLHRSGDTPVAPPAAPPAPGVIAPAPPPPPPAPKVQSRPQARPKASTPPPDATI